MSRRSSPDFDRILLDELEPPPIAEQFQVQFVSTVGYGRAVRQASCCGCGIGNGSSEKNVRQLRLAKGIPQERLAFAANLDRTYIGGIERRARKPSLLAMARIAEAPDVRLADLIAE